MAYISDIDDTTPAGTDQLSQGDNEIRQLKTDVSQSFPNVSGACTASHTDLNDVANKLVSFNGRTDTAAVPASADYELADTNSIGLGDVDITTPADGDLLQYNSTSTNWENVPKKLNGMAVYSEDADTDATTNDKFAYFVTEESDTIPAGLGTMTNSAADGCQFTAAAACIVSVSYSCDTNSSSNNDMAIVLNGAGTTEPFSQADTAIVARKNMGVSNEESLSGTVLCAASDVVSLNHRVSGRGDATEGIYRIVVQGV